LPVVDGIGDDDCWKTVDWNYIDQLWIPWGENNIPLDDFSGKFKVMWSSATNLMYFMVTTTDDVFVDGYVYPNTGYPDYDIVEVFIDEDKSGGNHIFDVTATGENAENAFSYHLAANAPAEGQITTSFYACDIAGTKWADRTTPNYASHFPSFTLKKTGNKYVYEFSLKIYNDNYLPANPEASRVNLSTGKKMGMSVAYCENDQASTTRDNFFGSVWVTAARYNSHWENANDYGELHLVSSAPAINHPPMLVAAIPEKSLSAASGEFTLIENLAFHFSDEDGDDLTYLVYRDGSGTAFSVDGGALKVTADAKFTSNSTVTIKAYDSGKLSATGTFLLKAVNQAPVFTGTIADLTLPGLGTSYPAISNITSIVNDPEGKSLSFTVVSDNNGVSASFSGNQLNVTGQTGFSGSATLTVKASDGEKFSEITFKVKYGNVGIANQLSQSFKCYPNPVTDGSLNLEFIAEGNGAVELSIVNLSGQTVYSASEMKNNSNFTKKLDLSELNTGFYLLNIRYKGERAVLRFTK